jgi:bis(5'-nucleosyl)-tetraphosphatase (symmetrical)
MAQLDNIFAVGDLQGCLEQLLCLIEKIGRDNITELWLTGDLVNRGPQSLETLRWCVLNKHWIKVVLGNHDMHLLAIAAGVRNPQRNDTLSKILTAPDKDMLIGWLRQQPLARYSKGYLLVHAGVLPQWSVEHTLELSAEVSHHLKADDWKQFLQSMYGDKPNKWTPQLRGSLRARVVINALTRLRFCTSEGEMEFATKDGSTHTPIGYQPWFEVANRMTRNTPIVFGHWSTLGLINSPKLLAIDTGCLWGRALTAISLPNKVSQNRSIVQVSGLTKTLKNN